MMDEAGVGTSPAQYRAFISYSHADSRFAVWLHRRLEGWTVPGEGRLAPIFIDRAELAAGPDLSAQVREALAGSAALIVIASPAARASRWVSQEITLFRELHSDAPVLAALIEGEPDEAFPEILLSHRGTAIEPLAADFREGRDGKRLGLLKIIAGLTGQRLDRLVQRDAQARQRRVMWITAGALLLSLVLAALLVIALRARSEAERQRAEAEGMVEFMLTDLRDKLKGVGRLDVMDAVNERAMKHYAGEDISSLDDQSLDRRARLLRAMGEDDLNLGNSAQALPKFTEAARITKLLQDRLPQDGQRIYEHAQSEFWLGNQAFLLGDKQHALPHWLRYKELSQQLVALQPKRLDWQREYGYAEANLCALALAPPANSSEALASCNSAVKVAEKVADLEPDKLQNQLDLTTNLAWQADAKASAGDKAGAVQLRLRQKRLADLLAQHFPQDARAMQARMVAEIGLGNAFAAAGNAPEAKAAAARATVLAEALAQKDPANFRWRDWRKQILRISQ
ncbi:MAG: toll/interleukin-1 receptor domain-containing protein [Novosphingobium sp.]